MSNEMTPMERFEATLNHEEPDYVPVSLFGGIFEVHFVPGMTVVDFGTSGEKMAKAHIAFYEQIGGDTIYHLSDMGLIVQGWGVKMDMPKEPDIHMALGDFAVNEPEDWEKLEVLDPKKDGRMHLYLDASRICRERYPNVPIGVSLPSPFTTTTHVCSMETALVHMLTEPDAFTKGLKTITQTVADFINACYEAGANFAGYLTTRASKEITTEEQYREFGAPSDKEVFRKTPDMTHIPHICGVEPMFDVVADYVKEYSNVKGISWWDRGATPNLKEAKEKWGDLLALMAGCDHTTTLVEGPVSAIEAEVKESCEVAMEGGGFILAPGCEISPKTPTEHMKAYFKAARKYGKY